MHFAVFPRRKTAVCLSVPQAEADCIALFAVCVLCPFKGKTGGWGERRGNCCFPREKVCQGKDVLWVTRYPWQKKSLSAVSREARREGTTGMLVGIKGKHLVAWCGARGGWFTNQHRVSALSSSLRIISPEEGGYFSLYSNECVYFDFSMTPSHACMQKVQADSPEKLFSSLCEVS